MSHTPRYRHDCDRCIFLGRYTQPKRCAHYSEGPEPEHPESSTEVDLYWCTSPTTPNLDSVIARFGDGGPEYASSHPPESVFTGRYEAAATKELRDGESSTYERS